MEESKGLIIKGGDGKIMIAQAKLKHDAFWTRMDRATKQVDRWPTWVKGSPKNEGNETASPKPVKVSTVESKTFAR